ncbi:MAG TPA: hypothetical protein VKT82_26015 [Ktedonobacterales bacterium]|nr:hypothetical protein [Ktedonobacterales bacterium]
MSSERQEPLQNLGVMVARIRATGGTGRLALRNTARMGTLHLYFERGQLVHLAGSHGSTDDALIDLAGWSSGVIRFDVGVLTERQTITPTQQEFFHRTLLMMQQRGVVGSDPRAAAPEIPYPPSPAFPSSGIGRTPDITSARAPVPPSSRPMPETFVPTIDDFLPPTYPQWPTSKYEAASQRAVPTTKPLPSSAPPLVSSTAEVLLSARQWELLVEVMRTMLESVGHLFGQQQAQNILQHALAERSEESEVLGLLQVDRQGWLREVRLHEMMTQSVRDVASAFVLLISDFERRCAALLGEEKARQMIARALYPYHDGLAEIGIALN